MSEPDSPRWLSEITDELRREVEVRPAWRARLIEDVARSPRPAAIDREDIRFAETLGPSRRAESNSHRRTIVLSPLAGLAAAVAFLALGAGLAYTLLVPRTTGVVPAGVARTRASTPTRLATDGLPGEREVVRFELAAPRASRVMLVGSFNEWNPAATPLVRDASTGKWTVSVHLPPGRHVYAFVVDGDVSADPGAPRAADDDFGSTNSVVFVSAPRT